MVYTQGLVEFRATGGTPNGPSTNSYPQLDNYIGPTAGQGTNGSTGHPFVPKNQAATMSYIVPTYAAPTYGTLTHDQPPTVGYFTISNAYGPTPCNTGYQIRMINQ